MYDAQILMSVLRELITVNRTAQIRMEDSTVLVCSRAMFCSQMKHRVQVKYFTRKIRMHIRGHQFPFLLFVQILMSVLWMMTDVSVTWHLMMITVVLQTV